MRSAVQGSVPSDQYNITTYTTSSQHGYGLGHSAAPGVEVGETAGFAIPLTPFAGVERRAMPPSPCKPTRQEQVGHVPDHRTRV